jgi:hypothetical protein
MREVWYGAGMRQDALRGEFVVRDEVGYQEKRALTGDDCRAWKGHGRLVT